MVTIKIKFRPSAAVGRPGTLYYQLSLYRQVKFINTGYKVFPHEWQPGFPLLTSSTKRRFYLAKVEEKVREDIRRLHQIIRHMERGGMPYILDEVVNAYLSCETDATSVRAFVHRLTMQLRRIGRERLAETYATTLSSLLRFRGDRGELRFTDISSDLMMEYEAYLKGNGLVPNTISFYMRNLRAIYNRAVEQGLTANRTPFKHVYTGIDKTVKRGVSSQIIRQIKELDLSMEASLQQSRDLFMFSFYTRGMSFVDMAYLKKKDLQNGILVYRRQKTDQLLYIKWEEPMQEIVNKYRNDASPYLLPIITTPGIEERRQYLNAIHLMNTNLKEIGERIHSPVALTSYVARHGWASIAKSRSVPLSVISEAMGHDSEATTRIYLASLDTVLVDKANSQVIHSLET